LDHKKVVNQLNSLNAIAAKHDATIQEIMIAWLLLSPHIIPIPGASKVQSILSSVKAGYIELEISDLEELDQVGRVI
jgi:aryl-alcohol dehydrogenase-like predicted oxidoreductase